MLALFSSWRWCLQGLGLIWVSAPPISTRKGILYRDLAASRVEVTEVADNARWAGAGPFSMPDGQAVAIR